MELSIDFYWSSFTIKKRKIQQFQVKLSTKANKDIKMFQYNLWVFNDLSYSVM